MPNTMFVQVENAAEKMGISVSYAYKLICKLNKKLTANSFTRNSIQRKQTTKGTTDNGSI